MSENRTVASCENDEAIRRLEKQEDEAGHRGKFLVVDCGSLAHLVGDDYPSLVRSLRETNPDAYVRVLKIGSESAGRIGHGARSGAR